MHYAAGRDRTGVLVALLLTVAGVTAEAIAADYAPTDACSPQPMRHTLTHLDQRHGGVRAYLLAAGVEPEALTAMRERLLSAEVGRDTPELRATGPLD